MSERILVFVAFGSLGDICPLLAVAENIARRRRVVFLANEYFRDFIEQRGVPFHPIGTVEDQLAAKESEQSTGETRDGRIHRFEHIIGRSFEPAFRYIKNLLDGKEQPVVISHGNLSPAAPACEAFNIPLIMTYYSSAHIPYNSEDMILCSSFYGKNEWILRHITIPIKNFFRKIRFDVKPRLNEYRIRFGLPPLPGFFRVLLYKMTFWTPTLRIGPPIPLKIAMLPGWFCDPVDKNLPDISFVGFSFLNPRTDASDSEIEAFLSANGKPIVFTPGTAVEDTEQLCRQIIPICRKVGAPGIFVSKHGRKAFDALEKVDDVPLLFIEHAEFDTLLPRSRCLIHHGGIGTAAQAIRAGIPQIIRPRMYDQPANGLRVVMHGLGGSLVPSHFNPDTVASVLDRLENNPLHTERIRYYADLVRKESGVQNSIYHIEQYLNTTAHTHEYRDPAQNLELC